MLGTSSEPQVRHSISLGGVGTAVVECRLENEPNEDSVREGFLDREEEAASSRDSGTVGSFDADDVVLLRLIEGREDTRRSALSVSTLAPTCEMLSSGVISASNTVGKLRLRGELDRLELFLVDRDDSASSLTGLSSLAIDVCVTFGS